jgi:hypothetical protein
MLTELEKLYFPLVDLEAQAGAGVSLAQRHTGGRAIPRADRSPILFPFRHLRLCRQRKAEGAAR